MAASKFLGVAGTDLLYKEEEIDWVGYYSGVGKSKLVRWLDREKVRLLQDALASFRPGSYVLDIGCGTGTILRASDSEHRYKIYGIERDPSLARVAKTSGLQIVCSDFNGVLPFKNRSFDVVVVIDAIEHVRSRLGIMNEIKRILTEEGMVVLFTPPYDSVTWILGEHVVYCLTGKLHVGHISPFTCESLAWLLKTNFQSICVQRLNFGLTLMGSGKGLK